MPTKTLTIAKEDDVTEADVIAALREFNTAVDVIEKRMTERDKKIARLRESTRASLDRMERLLGK